MSELVLRDGRHAGHMVIVFPLENFTTSTSSVCPLYRYIHFQPFVMGLLRVVHRCFVTPLRAVRMTNFLRLGNPS